jgi:hypothetical protein
MNCFTAMGLMSAYVDHLLPEQTARAVRFHIQVCEDCHIEYGIWKESSKLFKSDMARIVPIDTVSRSTIADSVMARITKEEPWAFPLTKRLVSVPLSIKKYMTSLAVLFLLVFGVMMVGSFQKTPPHASTENGEWKELSSRDIVMGIEQMKASTKRQDDTRDIRYRIVASLGDPIHLESHGTPLVPGIGLIAGFFGIMVTVVGMNWLSRN